LLLGSYGAVVDPAIFIAAHDNKGPSPELVRLHSARLVSASELPEGGRLSESVVKRLTGGDAITARDLYFLLVLSGPSGPKCFTVSGYATDARFG
jgi:putative DNA primase/helicase